MKSIRFIALLSLFTLPFYGDPAQENLVYMTPNQKKWAGYFDLDFLYWKPYSDSLDFGVSYLDYFFNATNVYRNNGDVKHADFPWKPGARISGGISSDSWDGKASWTYFESEGTREAFGQNYNPMFGDGLRAIRLFKIWGNGSRNQSYQCDLLRARYRILLNNIDLDVGKSFSLSKHWSIRPSFGAKGVYLQQKMHVRAELAADEDFSRVHIVNRYLGAGLRAAAETRFLFNRHFFLFAKGAGSLLDGRYLLKLLDIFNQPGLITEPIRSENRFDRNAVRVCFELSLGGNVAWTFNREKAAILLGAAYELQLWPEQFALPQIYRTFNYVRQAGDVSFHGLALNSSFVY
jgi:hypothetical protein